MPLSFDHSMRTKRGRIARQPRLYLGKRAAAWVKVETASSAPEPVPRFLELPDALERMSLITQPSIRTHSRGTASGKAGRTGCSRARLS